MIAGRSFSWRAAWSCAACWLLTRASLAGQGRDAKNARQRKRVGLVFEVVEPQCRLHLQHSLGIHGFNGDGFDGGAIDQQLIEFGAAGRQGKPEPALVNTGPVQVQRGLCDEPEQVIPGKQGVRISSPAQDAARLQYVVDGAGRDRKIPLAGRLPALQPPVVFDEPLELQFAMANLDIPVAGRAAAQQVDFPALGDRLTRCECSHALFGHPETGAEDAKLETRCSGIHIHARVGPVADALLPVAAVPQCRQPVTTETGQAIGLRGIAAQGNSSCANPGFAMPSPGCRAVIHSDPSRFSL